MYAAARCEEIHAGARAARLRCAQARDDTNPSANSAGPPRARARLRRGPDARPRPRARPLLGDLDPGFDEDRIATPAGGGPALGRLQPDSAVVAGGSAGQLIGYLPTEFVSELEVRGHEHGIRVRALRAESEHAPSAELPA